MNLFEAIKNNLNEADTTDWESIYKEVSSCRTADDLEELMHAYMTGTDFGKNSDIVMEIGDSYSVASAKKDLKSLAKEEMSKTDEDREREEQEDLDRLRKDLHDDIRRAKLGIKKAFKDLDCDLEFVKAYHYGLGNFANVSNIKDLPGFSFAYGLATGEVFKINKTLDSETFIGRMSPEEFRSKVDSLIDKNKNSSVDTVQHDLATIVTKFLDEFTNAGVPIGVTGMSKNILTIKIPNKKACWFTVLANVPGKAEGVFGLKYNYYGTRPEVDRLEEYKDFTDAVTKKFAKSGPVGKADALFDFSSISKICEFTFDYFKDNLSAE